MFGEDQQCVLVILVIIFQLGIEMTEEEMRTCQSLRPVVPDLSSISSILQPNPLSDFVHVHFYHCCNGLFVLISSSCMGNKRPALFYCPALTDKS